MPTNSANRDCRARTSACRCEVSTAASLSGSINCSPLEAAYFFPMPRASSDPRKIGGHRRCARHESGCPSTHSFACIPPPIGRNTTNAEGRLDGRLCERHRNAGPAESTFALRSFFQSTKCAGAEPRPSPRVSLRHFATRNDAACIESQSVIRFPTLIIVTTSRQGRLRFAMTRAY